MTLPRKAIEPGDVVTRNKGQEKVFTGTTQGRVRYFRKRSDPEGTVLDLTVKVNSRGHKIKYANVLWDGRADPSLHAVNRLKRKLDSK